MITPQNDPERRIISSKEWKEGSKWGKPRPDHPEGSIRRHVEQILDYIEEHYKNDKDYHQLRIIALVHDIGKAYPGESHHGERSAKIAQQWIDDEEILGVIREHDTPYHHWKKAQRGEFKTSDFINDFKNLNWQLLAKFRYADLCTRNQAPARWFEAKCKELLKNSA